MALRQGKVAIVTGSSRGIGRAIVERFACEGAAVARVDIEEHGGLALPWEAAASVECVGGDMTRSEDMEAAVRTTRERLGGLDASDEASLITGAALSSTAVSAPDSQPSPCSRQGPRSEVGDGVLHDR